MKNGKKPINDTYWECYCASNSFLLEKLDIENSYKDPTQDQLSTEVKLPLISKMQKNCIDYRYPWVA